MPFFDVLCNSCGKKKEEWLFRSKIEREGHFPPCDCGSTDRQILPHMPNINCKTHDKSSFSEYIKEGSRTGKLYDETFRDMGANRANLESI